MYPPIEPYEHGHLDVGDGNLMYWEACGNPGGKPALVVHGGPGSGCGPRARRGFDPARYRIILFDQRNCGRSRPHASDPAVDLSANTTHHLIADMERLRTHLGVDRWLLYGGSWGSTLILAYAETYPERVSEIVIPGVTVTRRRDVEWLYGTVGRYLPQQWERFRGHVPEYTGDDILEVLAAYGRRLADPDPDVRTAAIHAWVTWEDAVISHEVTGDPHAYSDRPPEALAALTRICAHYFSNAAWLEEGVLLREAHRLTGIPGVLIHGRLDLGGPLDVPWELTKSWPDARLIVVADDGHTGGPATRDHVLAALDGFASHHG